MEMSFLQYLYNFAAPNGDSQQLMSVFTIFFSIGGTYTVSPLVLGSQTQKRPLDIKPEADPPAASGSKGVFSTTSSFSLTTCLMLTSSSALLSAYCFKTPVREWEPHVCGYLGDCNKPLGTALIFRLTLVFIPLPILFYFFNLIRLSFDCCKIFDMFYLCWQPFKVS